MATEKVVKGPVVSITPPNIQILDVIVRGASNLVMHKFSEKARKEIMSKQTEGSTNQTKKKKREARDFDAEVEASKHISVDGKCGIPAVSFRNAMIDACRLVGFKMTHAKIGFFVQGDALDDQGKELVTITKGKPSRFDDYGRLETGVVCPVSRPRWAPGWEAKVRIRYDADQFTSQDVVNLLARAGAQVGILEGRPFSKKSAGMGWGLFDVVRE